jgi:hypothetical protein
MDTAAAGLRGVVAALVIAGAAFFHAQEGSLAMTGADGAGGIRCEIRERPSGRLLEIRAVAMAERRVDGEYRFDVTSNDGYGTSVTRQRGMFSLEPDTELVLGTVTIDADGFEASLQVTVDGRTFECPRLA